MGVPGGWPFFMSEVLSCGTRRRTSNTEQEEGTGDRYPEERPEPALRGELLDSETAKDEAFDPASPPLTRILFRQSFVC